MGDFDIILTFKKKQNMMQAAKKCGELFSCDAKTPEAATSGGSFSIWIILFLCDSIISYVSSNYNRYSTRCIQFEDFFFPTNNAAFVDVDPELTTNTL